MSDYRTLNPVPSIDPRDLDDNATNFDRFLHVHSSTVPDRFGVPRKTWWQMEMDADALVSPNVSALAALNGAADRLPYFTGAGALALTVLTTVGRSFLSAADLAGQRGALGLGTAAVLNAGTPGGAATLDAGGKLPVSQLPPLAINATFTVASQAAMLALTAERGDVAIRSDLGGAAYLLTADAPATLANWVPIQQNLGVALTALGALTPAVDTMPYFNGTGTAAATALTSQARAFLAATSQAAQRTALALGSAAVAPILGTVSQSAGVPTGAILERGSNANGEFVKYADGTMICTRTRTDTFAMAGATGSVFFGTSSAWVFPVAFVAAPVVQSSHQVPAQVVWGSHQAVSATQATFYVFSGVSIASAAVNQLLTAIGRWF